MRSEFTSVTLGGTVDITVHQVQADGSLSEVAKASGGAWGGTRVDQEFTDMLISIVGKDVFERYKKENTGDYLEMMREFEIKKRTITPDKSGKVTMRMPSSFVTYYKHEKRTDIATRLETMPKYRGKVAFKKDKVQIEAEVFKSFFEKPIVTTISHVKEILRGNDFRNINTFLLVGGFAESEIIQSRIREAFSDKRVITPNETGLVVLKGAVLFGHNPKIVRSRISKYTYGTEIINPFMEGVHPEKYKVFENGMYKCRYLFEPFVHAGDEVPIDSVVSKQFITDTFDVEEGVGIYASSSLHPQFVTESTCTKLGAIKLETARHRTLNEMQFGGTEFTMQITDLDTGVKRINCFDFLKHDA